MTHHWLLLRLTAHESHPVTHKDDVHLRTYFDEKPQDDSDLQKDGAEFVVPTERSITVPNNNASRLWFAITEAEYKASAYDLYVWAEPYTVAAISSPGVSEDYALGRLKLTAANEKYRGPASGAGPLHASVDPDDLVVTHDIRLANSVVQFIVDEMNTNARQKDILDNNKDIRDAREKLEHSGNWFTRSINGRILQDEIDEAEYELGHRTHKNEGWQGFLQDIYFLGGGEWDHKPIIRPVWGALNRLGNRHAVYFYDGWSNIHFGLIAARMGLPLENALRGAGQAQSVDNSGGGPNQTATGDDEADAQAITAGHNLGLRNRTVTRDDVINILNAHPGWIGRK